MSAMMISKRVPISLLPVLRGVILKSSAGWFSLGSGVGMTHVLLAPKIGYEFNSRVAVDGSVA